jgi:hypothetical protein
VDHRSGAASNPGRFIGLARSDSPRAEIAGLSLRREAITIAFAALAHAPEEREGGVRRHAIGSRAALASVENQRC